MHIEKLHIQNFKRNYLDVYKNYLSEYESLPYPAVNT
jgi:hypothetical protein